VLLFTASDEPAEAQDAVDEKVPRMIDRAREAYSPPMLRSSCSSQVSDDEIVVCAPDHGERWRVPPTSETDLTSHEALGDGLPRAPRLDRGSCKGQFGCATGGLAPPPVHMIDLSAIPEAQEGSDADKIAKGEMSDR